MLGKPKYNFGDLVETEVIYDKTKYKIQGKVDIIDAYGTFEDNSDVSYDILCETVPWNNQPCLVKHVKESNLKKVV